MTLTDPVNFLGVRTYLNRATTALGDNRGREHLFAGVLLRGHVKPMACRSLFAGCSSVSYQGRPLTAAARERRLQGSSDCLLFTSRAPNATPHPRLSQYCVPRQAGCILLWVACHLRIRDLHHGLTARGLFNGQGATLHVIPARVHSRLCIVDPIFILPTSYLSCCLLDRSRILGACRAPGLPDMPEFTSWWGEGDVESATLQV